MQKKLAIIYGTRPEFLKVYPVILEARKQKLDYISINVGQHNELLTEMEQIFGFVPDYSLKVQAPGYTNSELLAKIIREVSQVIVKEDVKSVLAQGDTFTVLASGIVAFLEGRQFFHVEAGLRTNNIRLPFPEEFNRRVVTLATTTNFAPTERSKNNLIREGVSERNIVLTGNTIVDLLKYVIQKEGITLRTSNKVLITAHRRENIGSNLLNICTAIAQLAAENPAITFYWSLHPNPAIRKQVTSSFESNIDNLKFLEPLNYVENVKLMAEALLLISDSGGIQEEAPTLQKRVLILREETERPEVLDCGCGILVGSNPESIKKAFYEELYLAGTHSFINPFGDGKASERIINVL